VIVVEVLVALVVEDEWGRVGDAANRLDAFHPGVVVGVYVLLLAVVVKAPVSAVGQFDVAAVGHASDVGEATPERAGLA